MQAFDYERPENLQAAISELSRYGARPLAGGTDLIVQMREGARDVAHVVDLKHIEGLVGISQGADGSLRIGAATPAAKITRDAVVCERYPALAAACGMIGSAQIQSRASLGGNVCNASPSADAVPPLISLGAKAEIVGAASLRTVDVETLFAGPGRTTLAPDDILVAFILPPPLARSTSIYMRFTPRREMDIAVVGVGVAIDIGPDDGILGARITLAAVGPTPVRATQAEAYLSGAVPNVAIVDEAARLAMADAKPISDTRGSADYRRELVGVLTRRSLAAALAKLGVEAGAA